MKLSLERKVQAGFVLAIGLLLVALASMWWGGSRSAAGFQQLGRIYQALHLLNHGREAIARAQVECRSFLITGDAKYETAFADACRDAEESIAQAGALSREHPLLREHFTRLAGLVREKVSFMNEGLAVRRSGSAADVQAFIGRERGGELMQAIRTVIAEIDRIQDARLESRFVATRDRTANAALFGLGGTSLAVVLVVAAKMAIRRNRKRRQLAESEQRRLAAIVESSHDAIISTGPDWTINSWNAGAQHLLGYTPAEIVGRHISAIFPSDRKPELAAIFEQLKRGLPVHQIESIRLHRDGRSIFVSAAISPLRDQSGRIVGASGILRDISMQKRMEEALRRSEESLAITLKSIGDAVLATDTDGRVTRMNPVAERLTGWAEADAAGQPLPDILRIVHEHTREPADLAVEKVLATGQIHGLAADAVLIARDGTNRPIADSAAPIRSDDGRILGMVLVFRDVTEERKAQEAIRESEHRLRTLNEELERRVEARTAALRQERLRYRALFEQSPIGVVLLDPTNGRIIDFNSAAHQQLGYTREQFSRLDIHQIEAVDGPAEIRARIEKLQQLGTAKFEGRHRTASGDLRDIVLSMRLIESGARPIIYCLFEDVTDRRRAERLAQRAQRLESLGTLAGGIAHDLNNALAPISMGLELLAMQCPREVGTIDLFRNSVKRGADMVRQLLTFARGAEGERVSIAPKQLVREMHAIVRATFPKDIAVEVKYPADAGAVVGDPTGLHQILLNLTVNARDAMPHGGTLTIETEGFEVDDVFAASVPDARPGKYIVFRVRDTGIGIPPHLLDRIFEPFFTTKGPEKGTGLGLSTVMGIVRGHRGFLQVVSEPGVGSTFSVYLPADLSLSDPVKADRSLTPARGAGELILFVDDEAMLRDIARVVLRRLNFQVATARDGLDALMQATERRNELHAIVTDLHMPHMDGLTFVRALRRMLPEIPVAIATGRADEEKMQELKTLGVTHRLDKPFTESQLSALLNELLQPGRSG